MPDELLTCQGMPWPPDVMERQSEVAGFILKLAAAGMDCRYRLLALRGLLSAPDPEVVAGPDTPPDAPPERLLPEPGGDDGNGGGW